MRDVSRRMRTGGALGLIKRFGGRRLGFEVSGGIKILRGGG